MSLDHLASRTQGIRESGEEWPFRVAAVAKDLEGELADPEVLQGVADSLLSLVEEFGCQAVSGASPVGATLAGAVVARSNNGLRLFSRDDPVDNVLIVDGLLATGTQLIRSVAAAREVGVRRTVGVAVLADRDALEICRDAAGDQVLALQEY